MSCELAALERESRERRQELRRRERVEKRIRDEGRRVAEMTVFLDWAGF